MVTVESELSASLSAAMVHVMKVRDSGMPEQDYWETLFDVPLILDQLGLDAQIGDGVEVGCGYGTFTLPVAGRIRGTLHAYDIESAMVAQTKARLEAARIKNVVVHERDVMAHGFSVPPRSIDAVLLFNILHAENPVEWLRQSAGLLSPRGRIAVIHWRSDIKTPRGPELSIRPRPEDIIEWARESGVLSVAAPARLLPPWHFGVTLRPIVA